MPHPRRLLVRLLLISLIIIATILFIKPNSKLAVKAAGCPGQNTSNSQIQISSGFLSISDPSQQGSYYYNANGDPNSNCLISNAANIESDFLSYESLFSTYYTQLTVSGVTKSPITSNNPIILNPLVASTTIYTNSTSVGGNGQSVILGSVGSSAISVNGVYVVFVDNDLYINSNIISSTDQSGVIFVVKGAVNIDPSVSEVDAFIIDYGAFCDNWNKNSNDCTDAKDSSGNSVTSTILFKGSIISLNDNSATNPSTGSLSFTRVSPNPSGSNPTPAESLNYQPKYFTLFKNIFSQDKTIWTEIK